MRSDNVKYMERNFKIAAVLMLMLVQLPDVLAQEKDTSFSFPVQMDEVVVKAAKEGWDVQGFIKRMQHDTTFYKAFMSLKVVAYQSLNDIQIFDSDKEMVASMHAKGVQTVDAGCRTMKVEEEHTTGNYYKKNGSPRYYTGELLEHLFLKKGTECGASDAVVKSTKEKGQIARSKEQLKQLVFNPGSKITGVPFIGDRASVFEPSISKLYDFKLRFVLYNGEECYLFQAIPKREHLSEVVFNKLDTWFRKSDYSIVARDYSLSYRTILYDFNVQMRVRLQKEGERMVPSSIHYEGEWHVMTKKRERARFDIEFMY